MSDIELVKEMLKHIGETDRDAILAEACYFMLESMEEPEPKPEPKPKKRKEKPFDMGKLKALLDGGWSVSKIADEMGVSEQTIYNKVKKIKEQDNG